MKYPVFVFHELVFRLAELNPKIGSYTSFSIKDVHFELFTSNGHLIVDRETISKQYINPRLLIQSDLELLILGFEYTQIPKLEKA